MAKDMSMEWGGQLNYSKRGEFFFVVNDWDYFRGEVMQVSEENDFSVLGMPPAWRNWKLASSKDDKTFYFRNHIIRKLTNPW